MLFIFVLFGWAVITFTNVLAVKRRQFSTMQYVHSINLVVSIISLKSLVMVLN
jgi:hypothetical protein